MYVYNNLTNLVAPPVPFDSRGQLSNQQIEFQPQTPSSLIFDADLLQITFPDDVQEEANSFFQAIYTQKPYMLSVQGLVEKLKTFKNSMDPRDHKLLACVVKSLFEEYKFFNEYPDRELRITAELYGGIIREGVINETTNCHFANVVRKIIESLSQHPTTKLFTFGLIVLEHCRAKLCTYPKVCSMISGLDNFMRFPPAIREYVQAGMTGDLKRVQEPGPRLSAPPAWTVPQATDNRTGSQNRGLSQVTAETLIRAARKEGAEAAKPSEAVIDKITFIFNNLSHTNIEAKKDDILKLIMEHGEPFIKWLAQYLVIKRISVEQNFQSLYVAFVQAIGHPRLDEYIKMETFRNIRILLRSDKRQAASNYSDRQLLKNLGMWLGSITIARDIPITIQELDLKSLLLEAYYKGQEELLFVVPFIVKTLMSCNNAKIFNSSCAWVKAILKVLNEIHNENDVKINIKFDIEVLCKELGVDLHSLPIEGILKDTDKLVRLPEQLSEVKPLSPPKQLADGSPVLGAESIQGPGNDTKPPSPQQENGTEMPVQSQFAYQDINVISYEGLIPHIKIRSNLPLFQLYPQLKQVVRPSLTLAIKELIDPVAERTHKIAFNVTEHMIKKDFAMDPNEKNLKTASFHMMRAMAAGMAMITCRDPLAVTMANALQNSFANALRNSVAPVDSAKMIEEAAQIITQDNVELGTSFIIKSACEKAVSEMEKRLEPEFQKRAAARQSGRQSFTEEGVQSIQNILPAQIALPNGETSKAQLEVYKHFSSRICGFKPSDTSVFEEINHELTSKEVETVLREWISACYNPATLRNPQEALSSILHTMNEHGCFSTDEKVSDFFRMCTEMCVDVTNKILKNDNDKSAHHSTIIRQRCYYTLDAYVKLIALMVKYSNGTQSQTKVTLLKKILSIITNVLLTEHEMKPKEFNSVAYHRILIILFNELTSLDGTDLAQQQWNVLEAFGQTLFMLQPRRVPGFAFGWLNIIGHRNVIGKLLEGSSDAAETIKMAAMYTQLIICHLKFLAPFLKNLQNPIPPSIEMLYKGTLRVLLVILHDFPELLCEFHYVICDTIPPNCVQLRNIILSAYPRNMRLPDPFTLTFKQIDSIPNIAQEPKSNLNMATIIPDQIRLVLDDYLTNRTNVNFLTALPNLLQISQTPGQKYNTTILNAVVLYVGSKAIENLHQKQMHINIQTIGHTSYMDVFQNLAIQFCTEGRYLLFNAIANQLRYPNAHTHYFSCVFLYLFLNSDNDVIQEQITRTLFERLVALRPHPWGLLITFIELIKNPLYKFWKYEFTRCAPEIERLFRNVSCY